MAAATNGRALSRMLSRPVHRFNSNISSSQPSHLSSQLRHASSSSRVQSDIQTSSTDSTAELPSTDSSSLSSAIKADVSETKALNTTNVNAIARTIPGPLEPSKVLPITHGHHVASLQFRTQGSRVAVEDLKFFSDFAVRAAHAMGIPTTRPKPLPMRKSLWTVPRGPFVHKKSQENFERRTHKCDVRAFDANVELVERWLHFLRIHAMAGVEMRAEVYRNVPLGFGAQMLAASMSELRQVPSNVKETTTTSEHDDVAAATTLRSSQADADKIRQLADEIVKEDAISQAQEGIDADQGVLQDSSASTAAAEQDATSSSEQAGNGSAKQS